MENRSIRRRSVLRALASLVAGLVLATCATTLEQAAPIDAGIPRWGHIELQVQLPHPGLDDDAVLVRGVFRSPSGRVVRVPGFAHRGAFAVRFSPDEVGEWHYQLEADRGSGFVGVAAGKFASVNGVLKGPVRRDPVEAHALSRPDGTPFVILGENRINIYDPHWNEGNRSIEDYVAYMAANGMSTLRVFVYSDCEDEESPDRVQLGCIEPKFGKFDDAAGDRFDRIFEAAEKQGISVIVSVFAIGFTPGPQEVWKSWDDNPYNAKNGGPVASPEDFFTNTRAREGAKKRLDYVLARWGAYPSFLAVDLLNEPEWDGPIAENVWVPWAIEMADYWRALDPYARLVTAGPVGLTWNLAGDERPWYAAPGDDLVQWHLYGKEFYDPHALAEEMQRRTNLTWGFGKPVFCGEFAYGGEPKPAYEHTHDGLWSAVFSGAGALAHSAPQFQVDSDELMTPERARHFKVLSDFLARLATRGVWTPRGDVSAYGAEAFTLGHADDRAVWLLAPESAGDEPVEAQLALPQLANGRYRVEWIDDVSGESLGAATVEVNAGTRLHSPKFRHHLAALLSREETAPASGTEQR